MAPDLRITRTDLPPRPQVLAAALRRARLPGVALLRGRRRSFVGALPSQESDALHPGAPRPESWRPDRSSEGGGRGADTPCWLGVLPYEARRAALERPAWRPVDTRAAPLFTEVRWRRYPSMLRVDHDASVVTLVTEDEAHARAMLDALASGAASSWPSPAPAGPVMVTPADAPDDHVARVAAARELILDGDLYQVNLARRLVLSGVDDPLGLFAAMVRRAPSPFSAVFEAAQGWVVSTTPELLLRVEPTGEGRRLVTEPIKGTRPRGVDEADDDALAAALEADPKERAELAMIVDVERNDLGSVAQTGTVRILRPPSVQRHPTVLHRSARLCALARPEVSDAAIVAAMVPSGSVTGAPKVRAMEVIASLESARRGLYTGGFGTVAHDGTMVLAMAIRTVTLSPDLQDGSYFTGGGIVADSDPARELEETHWKAVQLTG